MKSLQARRAFYSGTLLLGIACFSTLWESHKTIAPRDLIAPAHSEELSLTSTDPDGAGPRPDRVPRVSGELVVDFKDGFLPEELTAFNREYSLDCRYNSENSVEAGMTRTPIAEERMASLIARLEKDPRVETVNPNYVYSLPEEGQGVPYSMPAPKADDFPNDPMAKYQWHMDQIKTKEAWPISTGKHVVVSVIDTGVAYANWKDYTQVEDLAQTRFVKGYDFCHRRPEACDDHAHGTHVAGTIAQSTNNGVGVQGVAFDAAIMPIKVLSARGSGTLADIADGIRFSADHGATIINMSLGGGFADTTMGGACRYAHNKGVVVVCAAGNSNRPKPGYPAGYPECVSVAAVDYEENLTFYSNHGPDNQIAAPGGDTRSDKNGDGFPDGVLQNTLDGSIKRHGYLWFQGTSMASPHVAGVAALIESLGVTNPSAVERVLYSTARSKGKAGREAGFGAGILDAKRATWKAGIEYGAWRLGLALLIGILPAIAMLRRGYFLGLLMMGPALLMAASGAFFLPLLQGANTPASGFLTMGIPSWGMLLLGAAQHGNPLFFSCLIPLLAAVAVVEMRPLRALVAGLSAGFAAHLIFAAVSGTVSVLFVPVFLGRLWLLGNGLFCIFLSSVLGEEIP